MVKDTLFQSYEYLLNFVEAEHTADHKAGFCEDHKRLCVTCNWLVDANKNYDLLKELVKE